MALRNYELMMVLSPSMDDDATEEALNRVNQYVDNNGGTIEGQEKWGNVRKLAFPINNNTEGNYILTNLKLEPSSVEDLDTSLRVSENVLRHLLIKVDKFYEIAGSDNEPTSEVNAEPAVTENPEVNAEPAVTENPEVNAEPAVTENPEVNAEPAVTENPEANTDEPGPEEILSEDVEEDQVSEEVNEVESETEGDNKTEEADPDGSTLKQP
jgi:small subunit ribosomal protein S6